MEGRGRELLARRGKKEFPPEKMEVIQVWIQLNISEISFVFTRRSKLQTDLVHGIVTRALNANIDHRILEGAAHVVLEG